MQFPMIIGLRRSRFLDAMLLIVAMSGIASILSFQCSPSIRAGLLVADLALATLAWRALTPVIKAIRLERSGEISIVRVGESEFVQAMPRPGATIHPWLSVIHLTTEDGRPVTLIATVDSQNKADFRRLRMFMRCRVNFTEPNDDA